MGRFSVQVGLLGLAALAASCAGTLTSPAPGPSPRVECAQASVTIYFSEESATLQPLADPLIGQLMERVRACQDAGGELRELSIVPYPDSGSDRAMREAEIHERAARVRAALVESGAPNDKIRVRRPSRSDGAVMQRRAEVIAHLW